MNNEQFVVRIMFFPAIKALEKNRGRKNVGGLNRLSGLSSDLNIQPKQFHVRIRALSCSLEIQCKLTYRTQL